MKHDYQRFKVDRSGNICVQQASPSYVVTISFVILMRAQEKIKAVLGSLLLQLMLTSSIRGPKSLLPGRHLAGQLCTPAGGAGCQGGGGGVVPESGRHGWSLLRG